MNRRDSEREKDTSINCQQVNIVQSKINGDSVTDEAHCEHFALIETRRVSG